MGANKGLVTNYREGGLATKWNGGGGLPLRKRGGGRKGFSHAKGGAKKSCGVVSIR